MKSTTCIVLFILVLASDMVTAKKKPTPPPTPQPTTGCTLDTIRGTFAWISQGYVPSPNHKPPALQRMSVGWLQFDGHGKIVNGFRTYKTNQVLGHTNAKGSYNVTADCALQMTVMTNDNKTTTTTEFVGNIANNKLSIATVVTNPGAVITVNFYAVPNYQYYNPCGDYGELKQQTYVYSSQGVIGAGKRYAYAGRDTYSSGNKFQTLATYMPANTFPDRSQGTYVVDSNCGITWTYTDGGSYWGVLIQNGAGEHGYVWINTDKNVLEVGISGV